MSNYTITTDFGAKDSLPSGDSNKVIKGSEFTTEFTNIQTAIATKADTSGASFTGAVTLSDSLTTTANINLGNSDKLVFGNTGQLQIYTDGTDSFITESGSGSLKIKGNFLQLLSPDNELFFTGVADGSVSLFYNGSAHLATRLNGVSVYGGFDVDTDTLYVDDTNDRVGIGTTSPAQPLHIVDATDTTVIFESTDFNSRLELRDSSGSAFVENRGGILNLKSDTADAVVNSRIEFTVDNDEKMRIDSSGKVGIGTTSPTSTLDIRGEISFGTGLGQLSTIRSWSSTADADIYALMPASSTTAGTIIEGRPNAHIVVGLKDNDNSDCFSVIGTGATYSDTGSETDNAYDKNLFCVRGTGNVGIGTNSPDRQLTIANPTDSADMSFISGNAGNALIYFADTDDDNIGAIGYNHEFNFMNFRTNDLERMRIDSSGKVGIGTTSPATNLHVSSSGDTIARITSADGNGAFLDLGDASDPDGGRIVYDSGSNLGFSTSSTERMRIDSSGKVLVGKTIDDNAENGLVVNSNGYTKIVRTSGTANANSVLMLNRQSTVGSIVEFRKDDAVVGSISVTGSATSYNTSSDERLKENITDSADAGSKIDAIQIRQFDWKADGSHQDYGVIAQELVEVAPEAVHQPEDSEDMMGVDYSKLVPMLIKEVQSLRSRVAELENA